MTRNGEASTRTRGTGTRGSVAIGSVSPVSATRSSLSRELSATRNPVCGRQFPSYLVQCEGTVSRAGGEIGRRTGLKTYKQNLGSLYMYEYNRLIDKMP